MLFIGTLALAQIPFARLPSWLYDFLGYLSIFISASVYWAAFAGAFRASGLLISPNHSAALLVMGWLMLVSSKHWYLSIIPAGALMFTGARWAVVVFVFLSLVVGLKPKYSWRIIPGLLSALIFVLIFSGQVSSALRAVGSDRAATVQSDLSTRLGENFDVRTAGKGFIATGTTTPHSVPLRMALETGILSALAWCLLVILTLKQNNPRARLLMAGVGLLSLLYYFTWVGPLGAWYWIAVNRIGDKSQQSPDFVYDEKPSDTYRKPE